jgi:drug/metabolite transporter (DMT)-like permease
VTQSSEPRLSVERGVDVRTAASPSVGVHAALLTVQVLFGLWPVAGALLLVKMTPMALIFFRLGLAAPILAVAARLDRSGFPRALELLRLAGLAALGISLNQIFFIGGLARSGPLNASICVMLIPPFTVAIGALSGREKAKASRVLGIVVALFGAALLVEVERFDLSNGKMVGNLFLLVNTSLYAGYLVLVRGTIARLGALTTVAWVMLLGAIEALPATLVPATHVAWAGLEPKHWVAMVFVVLGPTVLTYLLNAYALGRAESSLVAVYVYAQPPIAATASYFAFGIVPTPRTVVAALVIVIGVALSSGLLRPKDASP